LLSPGDGGVRPLPQPVGQRPATKALEEVGALAQPPAGRGGLVTCLGPVGGLLQRPGGDRCRQDDQRQLARSPLGGRAHLLPPIVANNWTDGRCPLGYRSSRLSSTVPTTEATTENRIISRQPGQPPRGRIWIRPGRTGLAPSIPRGRPITDGACPVVDDRWASDYGAG
jgi:hypothetical protein